MGRRLALYIGSSIGNFNPKEYDRSVALVAHASNPGMRALFGHQYVSAKDIAPMLAYNDRAGVAGI